MATRTPSNQGGSSSGISDVKYQKAIKQISKLISLNTTLKNDNMKLQEKNEKLQADYDALQQKYNALQSQSSFGKQARSSQVVMEITNEPRFPQASISKEFKDGSSEIQEFIESKRQMEMLEAKLGEKDEKIGKLRTELENKIGEIGELKHKVAGLQEQLRKAEQSSKNDRNSEAKQKQNIKLRKQLQNSQQWVKKISNDYEMLKKQLMFNSKSSINANSIEISASVPGSHQDVLSEFYLQKLKKSEASNLKIKKQYIDKKQKLKAQIEKLKQENQTQLRKLLNLTSFVEKQQSFIEKFIMSEKAQAYEVC